jgi:hypothetical protein
MNCRALSRDLCRRESGRRGADGEGGERHLARADDTEYVVQTIVDEPRVEARFESVRGGEREQVRKHRAGVPPDVPVAALAVLPAGARRDTGQDNERGDVGRNRSGVRDSPEGIAFGDPDERVGERVE